jgi:Tol biopolymer transport system component
MRRRSFLLVAGAATASTRKSAAETPLGTLTWVQPDGLWIRELSGGKAAKIASGGGLHAPRFSPSGRVVSFLDREEKPAAVRIDGKPGALFNAAAASQLRPDGRRYAAVRIRERPPGPHGAYQATAELEVAATTPNAKPHVLLSNEGNIRLYAWTRDGESIVYWRADEWSASLWADGVDLYSIPASGGPERKLGVSALAHDDVLDLAPKSAGNRLAVTRSAGRETWSGQTIAIVDLGSGAVRNLTGGNMAALGPAWSPDGRRIACFAAPDAGNIGGGEAAHRNLHQRKIWLLDPSGAGVPRQLTGDPHYRDEAPLWSADGRHILFGRMDYDAHTSLSLMESSGANLAPIGPLKIYHPLEGDKEGWFGFYGYLDWRSAFDWRRS